MAVDMEVGVAALSGAGLEQRALQLSLSDLGTLTSLKMTENLIYLWSQRSHRSAVNVLAMAMGVAGESVLSSPHCRELGARGWADQALWPFCLQKSSKGSLHPKGG